MSLWAHIFHPRGVAQCLVQTRYLLNIYLINGGKKRQSLTRLTYKGKTVHVFDVSPEATTLPCGFNSVAGWDHAMLHIAVRQKAKMASAFDPDWKSPLCHSIHMTLCLMPIKAWYGKSCRSITASTLSEIWAGKSPPQSSLLICIYPSLVLKYSPSSSLNLKILWNIQSPPQMLLLSSNSVPGHQEPLRLASYKPNLWASLMALTKFSPCLMIFHMYICLYC